MFDRIGIDYAGPILIQLGYVHRPIITKAYVCVFVGFAIKAVHLPAGVRTNFNSIHRYASKVYHTAW